MGQFDKKQSVYILVIILAVLQLFFNRNNPLPKVSLISPTNSPVPSPTTIITPSEKQLVKVVRAIDGDTVEIEGNIKVRYIGINTPELHDPRRPVQCYGQISADENKKLVEGKEVYIQKDVSEVDKYKRLLRYVWVGDAFVNDYLVRQGFAQVSTFPPDVRYHQQFLEAQKEAQVNNRGLWKECPTN